MKNLREFVRATVRDVLRESDLFNEVRYIKSKDIHKETPLKDTETIRVYHGFNKFDDAVDVLKNGLSGKERAKRIYSYEMGNNPYGLFVTVDFNVIKRGGFAHSGVIIEFSTKVSDLEAPVWVGGRSYFIQGEYAHSFKNLEEREQQRLINRQRAGQSPYDFISKSDRPELADTIFDNPEKQALYIGDLNPNMIKAVWYNEVLHKDRRINGDWVRMSRKEFIKKLKIDAERSRNLRYFPNDEFDFDEFVQKYFRGDYESSWLASFLEFHVNEYDLKNSGFFPKQIKKFMQMKRDGEFDKYIK
jgi:hypothetical protein